jgi:4-diphosphocytidyl-2-C-methyl-D-erythritol kinase
VTEELAFAKVNLCLLLGPLRDDGRHEIVSVMQSVDLADRLRLSDAEGPDTVVCPGVPGPNLASDALAAFRSATGWDGPGQLLEIDKRIPVAAGMGGGSADAAAALRLIARRAGIDDEALLLELAFGLGADVPGQLAPGRVLACGAGERLVPLPQAAPLEILVLPSAAQLSTAAVYSEADRLGLCRPADELRQWEASLIRGRSLPELNDLGPAARSLEPSIGAALDEARAAGAGHVLVCGSGPTVIGVFDRPGQADAAAERLAGRLPAPIVARPVGDVRHN